MKRPFVPSLFFLFRDLVLKAFAVALLLGCVPGVIQAANQRPLRVNRYGAPVVDAKGHRITYNKESLEAMARKKGATEPHPCIGQATALKRGGFSPAGGQTQQPFWQYAVFGAGIGATNIVIAPAPPGSTPEIIIGGYAYSGVADSPQGFDSTDNFWQVIQYNTTTGNYDQLFVSPIYQGINGNPYANIVRIGLAHVTSTSEWQIVVMLDDGRIFLYDFDTKVELGYLDTSISGLKSLSLTDLDGDGLAELIATDDNNLYVFNATGQLLWQLADAGGSDVVVGIMDNSGSLEIATTSGKVIDATTHAVVWDYQNGFGFRLRLAPFSGESYQQLIVAEPWDFIYSYDVGRQLPRWSISTFDNDALEVADVDNDGVPEVILGDGQWGSVHVYDLNTQALKWEVSNPDHGVTNIAVGDVDNDGVAELLWGAGWSDTGADHLYVASTTSPHSIKWQSIDLEGPFLGPAIGDLDGDGQPELVICSLYSNAGYDSGRILVFDLATLTLRAISDPVVDDFAWTGVHDLKLRDVDGNGRMSIMIGADYLYDGAIEIYRFDPNNTFTRVWTNATRPMGNPFNFVDAADLDNDGTIKIIAGNTVADTGSDGVYIYAYDYPSGVQSWRSVALASGFSSVLGLIVDDLNGDGNKEIAALVSTGDLYTWDGPSRQLLNLQPGTNGTVLSNVATPSGLVLGDTSGVGHFWQWGTSSYTETFTRQLTTECDPFSGCFSGINVSSDDALWTGSGGTLNQRLSPSYDAVVWQAPPIGNGFGRFVATAARNGQNCVFSSALQAAVGLTYGAAPTPTPTPTPTASPTMTPTPTATATTTPSATPRQTPTPRISPAPRPRPTPPPRP
jgi:hypothetical protein